MVESGIWDLINPQSLAGQLQLGIDSIAGQHVSVSSLDVLGGALSSINLRPLIVDLIIIVPLLIITIIAARFTDRILKRYLPKVVGRVDIEGDETISIIVRRIASAAIYLLGLTLIILQIPQLSQVATAVLAGAGIAGLAIGLAAGDSLSNFISGISIAVFQPFRVGDYVDFENNYGQVEDLTLRHTVIKTWDSRRIIVPNSIVSKQSIINWSIRAHEITWTVEFEISKPSEIDRARGIIIREAERHPMVLKDRPIKVLLTDIESSKNKLALFIRLSGRNIAYDTGCEIREAVWKRFDLEGIDVPK